MRFGCLILLLVCAVPCYGPVRESKEYLFCNSEVFRLVKKYSKDNGVPLSLSLAVISVESKFNTNAVGKHGEKGLFQLMRIHGADRENLEGNIRIGVEYLSKQVSRFGTVGGLRRYNGGVRWASKPSTLRYACKVLNEENKMKQELWLYQRSLSLEQLIP